MDRTIDNGIVLLRLWALNECDGAISGTFSTYWWVAAFGPPNLQFISVPSEGIQLNGQRLPSAVEWTHLPVYQDRDLTTMSTWHLAQQLTGRMLVKG